MGTQNRHNGPLLEPASLKKRKRKVMTRGKQIAKISKKGNGTIYAEKNCNAISEIL